jgi:hypothetical protein
MDDPTQMVATAKVDTTQRLMRADRTRVLRNHLNTHGVTYTMCTLSGRSTHYYDCKLPGVGELRSRKDESMYDFFYRCASRIECLVD